MFTGTNIRLRLNTHTDLSIATDLHIRYRTPTGQTGSWPAQFDEADDTVMYYDTQQGDFNRSGIWDFQAIVDYNGNINKGRIARVFIHKPITVED